MSKHAKRKMPKDAIIAEWQGYIEFDEAEADAELRLVEDNPQAELDEDDSGSETGDPIALYLHDIGATPILTRHEEAELVK